jgi:hypothetical protein
VKLRYLRLLNLQREIEDKTTSSLYHHFIVLGAVLFVICFFSVYDTPHTVSLILESNRKDRMLPASLRKSVVRIYPAPNKGAHLYNKRPCILRIAIYYNLNIITFLIDHLKKLPHKCSEPFRKALKNKKSSILGFFFLFSLKQCSKVESPNKINLAEPKKKICIKTQKIPLGVLEGVKPWHGN